ncbi:MAG TPA: M48 family metalloprotease [Candidatus Polarisedimenticolia bacterium]|nr:M48 family metalloprotease [Candidatus Polarisedimenticolia bacterium]
MNMTGSQARRPFLGSLTLLALAAALATAPAVAGSGKAVKLTGYLEYRKGNAIIVDAQRVVADGKTKFHGSGKAKDLASTPLGYGVQVKGERRPDGVVQAKDITVKKNGMDFLEEDVLSGTAQAEKAYVQAKKVYDQGPDGQEKVVGTLITTGPQVDRCRKIVDRLLPSYIDPKTVRVYVVDNKEWNAMAMANYSIYVFSGLMADMDDDELAIVLGHEIAHATYEHSRRQASKGMASGIAGTVAQIGTQMIGNDLGRAAAESATALSMTTFGNVYSREYEDQADRVGLRYVYEAGYDVTKAPNLWRRFAAKYGDQSKIENFFFGNHSLSTERAKALEAEIKNNYADAAKDPPTHAKGTATG